MDALNISDERAVPTVEINSLVEGDCFMSNDDPFILSCEEPILAFNLYALQLQEFEPDVMVESVQIDVNIKSV